MDNQDKKREMILEAALKRFSHFGLAKTTMSEIAGDLSFSKALLYYYFPDKISLFAAVMEDVIQKLSGSVRLLILDQDDTIQAVYLHLEKRQEFLKKYYNLLQFTKVAGPEIPDAVLHVFNWAKNSERDLFIEILNKGVARGEFRLENVEETAAILLDALVGMRMDALVPKLFLPTPEQFEHILIREKALARIFILGLGAS